MSAVIDAEVIDGKRLPEQRGGQTFDYVARLVDRRRKEVFYVGIQQQDQTYVHAQRAHHETMSYRRQEEAAPTVTGPDTYAGYLEPGLEPGLDTTATTEIISYYRRLREWCPQGL